MISDTDAPSSGYVKIQHTSAHFHQRYLDLDFDITSINDEKMDVLGSSQERYLVELFKFIPIRPEDTILDIGCGTGATAIWLAKQFGCTVYGLDIVEENINVAKQQIKHEQLEHLVQVQQLDASKMDFAPQKFDHVISVETIYHIEDKKALFCKINEILKPAGYLVLSDYLLEKPCSWFLEEVVKDLIEGQHMLGLAGYHKIFDDIGFVRVNERNVTQNTIANLVESERVYKFPYAKYTSGNSILSRTMINLFGPMILNSIEKGIKEKKLGLYFMTYQLTA